MMPPTTPMMQQYEQIKSRHRDAILFFRLGDFYEMFREDALEASTLLDLTLTRRNGVPMCGIPYHASSTYIARLLKAGRKIAICEQTLLPPKGKGLARREITEIVTPGTVVDENLLERGSNNFLVCLTRVGDAIAFAFIDPSTAEFQATHFPLQDRSERLRKEFQRLQPKEILIQESLLEEDGAIKEILSEWEGLVVNRYPDWHFHLGSNQALLERQFGTSNLKGFGLREGDVEIAAAGVIIAYIAETAKSRLPHIRGLSVTREEDYLGLDEATLRNLEIVQNLNDRSRKFTLLEVLDHTRTAMGARKLKRWLLKPLRDRTTIESRLAIVDFFFRNQVLLSQLRECLSRFLDLERLTARLGLGKAHAKDLLAIQASLQSAFEITALMVNFPELNFLFEPQRLAETSLRELKDLLERSLAENPSILLTEGNLIRSGYDPEVDRLRELKENSRGVMRRYLEEERKRTGIASLKLKHNRILGYFLEVTKPNLSLVPANYIRRQTLVGGDRYTTSELSDRESEINSASERIVELERELFLKVRGQAAERISALLDLGDLASTLDVLQSFAFTATINGYVRPILSGESLLSIEEGRHPVVEAHLPAGSFVPNSLTLGGSAPAFVLLTGPNMAGKSTFLRQAALIALMAHVGSFVPAREVRVGILDNIFCRVGATDNLARGESTFLVEMNETAYILRSATESSLIIMDEVGRGTGTKDGLAIAWAILEHLLERVKAKTLFATHYHELSAVSRSGLRNLSMAVIEDQERIVFLKRVQEGPASRSYGIHVARLAGIPEEIIRRAGGLLEEALEKDGLHPPEGGPLPAAGRAQGTLFSVQDLIREEIVNLDLERITPLEALNRIARWKKEIAHEKGG